MTSRESISGVIDHTFLKTEAEGVSRPEQEAEVQKLVEEAHRYGAFGVCVREAWVAKARRLVDSLGSSVRVVSVIGFPLGDDFTTEEKVGLLEKAKSDGADEFDMVFRYQAFKNGDSAAAFDDVVAVSKAAGGATLKLIFENAYLNESQKKQAFALGIEAFEASGADLSTRFLKTSTGFANNKEGKPIGATLDDVRLMHEIGRGRLGIKPAGGVGSLEDAVAYFEAVGSPALNGKMDPKKFRIGTSSLLAKLHGTRGTGDY